MAKIRESARLIEALSDGSGGEKVFKVVLITEGLGNLRQKNYYGPEAIASAVKVYEGKSCYINHQDAAEEETLPERDIRDKAGYFKNLNLIEVDGLKACAGELHCDLSESGRFLAEKMQSALHYKKEFPSIDRDYCGLSVNGDGDAERRTMQVAGEDLLVNYVLAFTEESESCDLVTTPARGGKVLASLKESNGAQTPVKKEESMKLKKLIGALKSIGESLKKYTGADKATLVEAVREAEGEVAAAQSEGESEAFLDKKESESEEEYQARLGDLQKKIGAKMMPPKESETEVDDEEEKDEKALESKRPLTADELERNQIAIKFLVKESGLPADCYSDSKVVKLSKMPFAEAKAIIEGDAKLAASILRESGIPVASLHRSVKESNSGKAAFMESFKEGE